MSLFNSFNQLPIIIVSGEAVFLLLKLNEKHCWPGVGRNNQYSPGSELLDTPGTLSPFKQHEYILYSFTLFYSHNCNRDLMKVMCRVDYFSIDSSKKWRVYCFLMRAPMRMQFLMNNRVQEEDTVPGQKTGDENSDGDEYSGVVGDERCAASVPLHASHQ